MSENTASESLKHILKQQEAIAKLVAPKINPNIFRAVTIMNSSPIAQLAQQITENPSFKVLSQLSNKAVARNKNLEINPDLYRAMAVMNDLARDFLTDFQANYELEDANNLTKTIRVTKRNSTKRQEDDRLEVDAVHEIKIAPGQPLETPSPSSNELEAQSNTLFEMLNAFLVKCGEMEDDKRVKGIKFLIWIYTCWLLINSFFPYIQLRSIAFNDNETAIVYTTSDDQFELLIEPPDAIDDAQEN